MNQRERNERGNRMLADMARLLEVEDENARLLEENRRLDTALQVAVREGDSLRAEVTSSGIRYDMLHEKYMTLRVKVEAIRQQARDEFERMKTLRSEIEMSAMEAIEEAEMAPYAPEGKRPLARLEMN